MKKILFFCVTVLATVCFAQEGNERMSSAFLRALADEIIDAKIANNADKVQLLETLLSNLSSEDQEIVEIQAQMNPKAYPLIVKKRFSEIWTNFSAYKTATNAYAVGANGLGSWRHIGYDGPQSSTFKYTEITYGVKAISKISLASCPRGSSWTINAKYDSNTGKTSYKCTVSGPKACKDIVPDLGKLCDIIE